MTAFFPTVGEPTPVLVTLLIARTDNQQKQMEGGGFA